MSESPEVRKCPESVLKKNFEKRIFCPVNDNGQWRIRYNYEVYELHKEPDLVTYIKIRAYSEDVKYMDP
jgi:hypothetical protein